MRLGLTVAIALPMLLLPPQAQALDCVVSTPASEYWWKKADKANWEWVFGQFSDPRPADARKKDFRGKVSSDSSGSEFPFEVWTAKFTGFSASRKAFDQPFNAEVTLILPDYYGMSGRNSAGEVKHFGERTGLVWLEKTETGYQVLASACAEIVDTDPSHVKPALKCLTGRYCPNPFD